VSFGGGGEARLYVRLQPHAPVVCGIGEWAQPGRPCPAVKRRDLQRFFARRWGVCVCLRTPGHPGESQGGRGRRARGTRDGVEDTVAGQSRPVRRGEAPGPRGPCDPRRGIGRVVVLVNGGCLQRAACAREEDSSKNRAKGGRVSNAGSPSRADRGPVLRQASYQASDQASYQDTCPQGRAAGQSKPRGEEGRGHRLAEGK
jgi:hypothetical protein